MSSPLQPTNRTATWQFVIANRAMENVAFLTPHPDVVRYTRRDSDYCEIVLSITNREDLNALEGAAYSRVLRAWRNGVNRFNGEFVELRETADSWELVAKDPFFNLNWRDVRAPVTFTNVDKGQMAWELIDLQNGYQDTHLRQGDLGISADLTRSFSPGERVAERIKYLTNLPDPFSFTINAYEGVDNATGDWAHFAVRYPTGVLMPEARFEFGAGTLENCDDYLREALPLVNRANVVGKDSNLVASGESITSPDLHGLWEGDRGQVMTDDTAQLQEIADASITNAPVYSIVMSAGPHAPQLFTDFDVGNTVPVLIRRLGRTITGEKRVKEAVVLLDADSGAEELESIEVYE